MSGPPIVEVAFPVVTAPTHVHGLRCMVCNRIIYEGQPYRRHVQCIDHHGDTYSVTTCVYCPAPPDEGWPA